MTDVSPVVQVPHPLSIDHSAHGCHTTHKLLSTTTQQLFDTFLQVFLCANNEATYTTKKRRYTLVHAHGLTGSIMR